MGPYASCLTNVRFYTLVFRLKGNAFLCAYVHIRLVHHNQEDEEEKGHFTIQNQKVFDIFSLVLRLETKCLILNSRVIA